MRSWKVTAGLGALAAFLCGAGCATSVTDATKAGSGGGGGDDTAAASTGSTGGSTTGAGGAGGAPPSGDCVKKEDCAYLDGACVVGACINGQCATQPANDLQPCDDGLYCTEGDTCQNGECVGGTSKYCPSNDPCHVGVCDEASKACMQAPGNDGAACDDNDPCTYAGTCSGGTCNKGPVVDCSAFDGECSVGVCDPVLGCQAQPKNDGAACNDMKGSPCSTGQCTAGTCKSIPTNEGNSCDDGLFCTIQDKCTNGTCAGTPGTPCAPANGCFIAQCDEANDTCTAVPGNDGAACDDGNDCTSGTTCSSGACIGGVASNDGLACDDHSACTSNTTCTAGVCGGGQGPTVYFADDFHDDSKGWLKDTEWQIGPAKASVGGVFGADPDTDHTPTPDNGVAGVVIGGNENPVVHPFYWITSPSFDTSNAQGQVVLGYWRWLNSDYDPYMHNEVDVFDGVQWVQVWKSGAAPGIQDSPPSGQGWTFESFDVTAYKNAQMRVRFGYDIGSAGVYTIGSWNLDDVMVGSAACP